MKIAIAWLVWSLLLPSVECQRRGRSSGKKKDSKKSKAGSSTAHYSPEEGSLPPPDTSNSDSPGGFFAPPASMSNSQCNSFGFLGAETVPAYLVMEFDIVQLVVEAFVFSEGSA